MMKIRDIMAIVAVALAASGCNQQDDGAQQDERLPILLKASVDVEAVGQTRSAGDWGERTTTMTQGSEFLAGEQVMAYIKEGDGTNPATIKWPIEYVVVNDGDGDADDGDLDPKTDTTPFYFPVGVNTINIHAIHPSYTSDAGFTVETDQTTEANYAKSDLCYSKPRDYTRSGTTAYLDANGRRVLQFKHLLSKIIVNLTVDATAATSAPSYISLHAKTTTAMTFPVDNANGYTGCTASDASYPGVIKMKQEAIIPPQDIAAGASFISMNVPGIGSMIYPMPTATSFESGKKYTYNLTVTDVGITATTSIGEWGDPVDGGFNQGKTYGDIMMNPLWYVAEFNMTNTVAETTLTMGNADNQGYYYTWANAMTKFSNNSSSKLNYYVGNKVIDGQTGTWHLPTVYEFNSILPLNITPTTFVENDLNFNLSSIVGSDNSSAAFSKTVTLCFGYNATTKGNITESSYWYRKDVNTYYAIRYCGRDYCSVWKYEKTVDVSSNIILNITSKLLPYIISTNDAARIYGTNESKWVAEFDDLVFNSTNHGIDLSHSAVQRRLCGLGYRGSTSGNSPEYSLGTGWYWTATTGYARGTTSATNGNHLWFNSSGEHLYHASNTGYGFTVRLFRDN